MFGFLLRLSIVWLFKLNGLHHWPKVEGRGLAYLPLLAYCMGERVKVPPLGVVAGKRSQMSCKTQIRSSGHANGKAEAGLETLL